LVDFEVFRWNLENATKVLKDIQGHKGLGRVWPWIWPKFDHTCVWTWSIGSLGLIGEVFQVRTQVDRDLTIVSRVDRLLWLIKNLGRHSEILEPPKTHHKNAFVPKLNHLRNRLDTTPAPPVFPPQTDNFQKPIKLKSVLGNEFFGKKGEKPCRRNWVRRSPSPKRICWQCKIVLKFTASLRVTWCLFHQGGSSLDLSIQQSESNH
jgi:hypothetical protein